MNSLKIHEGRNLTLEEPWKYNWLLKPYWSIRCEYESDDKFLEYVFLDKSLDQPGCDIALVRNSRHSRFGIVDACNSEQHFDRVRSVFLTVVLYSGVTSIICASLICYKLCRNCIARNKQIDTLDDTELEFMGDINSKLENAYEEKVGEKISHREV